MKVVRGVQKFGIALSQELFCQLAELSVFFQKQYWKILQLFVKCCFPDQDGNCA
jgi:hypothetical protein